jgi:hypothetical protein
MQPPRATTIESMLLDFPRSRPARRASAISLVATRTTRSPRAIKSAQKEPATADLKRQTPLALQAARPTHQASASVGADRDGLLTEQLAARR